MTWRTGHSEAAVRPSENPEQPRTPGTSRNGKTPDNLLFENCLTVNKHLPSFVELYAKMKTKKRNRTRILCRAFEDAPGRRASAVFDHPIPRGYPVRSGADRPYDTNACTPTTTDTKQRSIYLGTKRHIVEHPHGPAPNTLSNAYPMFRRNALSAQHLPTCSSTARSGSRTVKVRNPSLTATLPERANPRVRCRLHGGWRGPLYAWRRRFL